MITCNIHWLFTGCGSGKYLGINKDLMMLGCDYSNNLLSGAQHGSQHGSRSGSHQVCFIYVHTKIMISIFIYMPDIVGINISCKLHKLNFFSNQFL